jgi:hypothetical protein
MVDFATRWDNNGSAARARGVEEAIHTSQGATRIKYVRKMLGSEILFTYKGRLDGTGISLKTPANTVILRRAAFRAYYG